MINNMKLYDYYLLDTDNGYGELIPSKLPVGKIKLSIFVTSQAIQDNINYRDCNYVGLTHDTKVDDTYIIDYEGKKLKVLYVNELGRFNQVFLQEFN